MVSAYAGFVFYAYTPSKAGAAIMCILFLATALVQIWMMIRQKTWYFIPFVIGCLFEGIGYVGRLMSSTQAPNYTKMPYIIQSVLLLLGPTLFAASIYMVLGRLIRLVRGEQYSLIRPRWLTKLFVCGDVVSFCAQGGGGGILVMAKTESSIKLGQNIIVAGLVLQILFFGCFIAVTMVFHTRMRKWPTTESKMIASPWQGLILVLYFSSFLIMIRSIYRVAEYVAGTTSVMQTEEMYLYIFDSLPMALTTIAFCAFHPSRVVSRHALADARLNSGLSLEEVGSEAVLRK